MADQEVVIVDDNGTEHIFPAGFDPQKAIGIVRQQTSTVKPLSIPETANTPMSRARVQRPASEDSRLAASFMADDSIKGLKGAVKAAVPGAVKGAVDMALSPIRIVKGAVGAGYGMLTDPIGTISSAYDKITGIPSQIADYESEMEDLGRKDPEALGAEIGRITGETMGGIGLSAAVPLAAHPIARKAGGMLEKAGSSHGWPIRMMGAHQLGSGNPIGAAMMVLPEYMQSTGAALRAWGETEPAFAQAAIDKFKGTSTPTAAQRIGGETTIDRTPPVRILESKPDVFDRNRNFARLEEKMSLSEIKEAREAAKIADNARKADLITKQREGMVEGKPSFRESISAETPEGGRQSMSRSFSAPEEELAGGLTKGELAQLERQIPDPVLRAQVIEKFKAEKAGGTPVGAQPVKLAPTPKPSAPSTPTVPRVPLKDVVGSKSRRSTMSTINPKLTLDEEAELFGNGPVFKITELPQKILQQLMERRAARQAMHRTNAGLDAGAQRAMQKED